MRPRQSSSVLVSYAPTDSMMARPPSTPRVVGVTLLAVGLSIAVDAGLVWLGTAITPSTIHYSHFRVLDYGSLTIVGVACAGVAWAMVARIVSSPRAFFLRLAIVATLILLLPDAWLLLRHQPPQAVVVLMGMHLAIALITYPLLVFLAPVRPPSAAEEPAAVVVVDSSLLDPETSTSKGAWRVMLAAVVVEFVVGLAGMVVVPLSRPNGWTTHKGQALYLTHAVLGGALGIGALALVLVVTQKVRAPRLERIGAITGLCGVAVGAIGGIMCYSHSLRLAGLAVMFVGISVAFFGYVMPLAGESDDTTQTASVGDGDVDSDQTVTE